MAITGVSHMGLCVSDIDASLHFYCDILGFTKRMTFADAESEDTERLLELKGLRFSLTFVELEGMRIELIDIRNPRPTGGGKPPFNRIGYTHLSVKVRDFDAELERMRRENVTVLEDTIGGSPHSNARFAFILDPDGNRVELFGAYDEAARKPWEFD